MNSVVRCLAPALFLPQRPPTDPCLPNPAILYLPQALLPCGSRRLCHHSQRRGQLGQHGPCLLCGGARRVRGKPPGAQRRDAECVAECVPDGVRLLMLKGEVVNGCVSHTAEGPSFKFSNIMYVFLAEHIQHGRTAFLGCFRRHFVQL